jgi:hypothetical protein
MHSFLWETEEGNILSGGEDALLFLPGLAVLEKLAALRKIIALMFARGTWRWQDNLARRRAQIIWRLWER